MINKIQPNLPAGYTNSIGQTDGKVGEIAKTGRLAEQSSAEVSLSKDAVALQKIMQAVKDSPDVREDLVQNIRQQIESGTYKINTDRLAEQLLPLMK